MISPAKGNNVDNNSPDNLNIKKSSQNAETALSQLQDIRNLPVELIQAIAFKLNSKDYASLRETCKAMSQSLDSFSVLNTKLKQGVKGNTEKNIREVMLDCQIRNILSGKEKKEIILAMKNCYVGPHELFKNTISVGTGYVIANRDCELTDNGIRKDCVRDSIDLVRRGIKSFIASGSGKSFNPSLNPGKLWTLEIQFRDSDLNKESLGDIFSSFNEVYHDTKGSERFVVAHMASKLLNYWAETPPSRVNKNDINHIPLSFPELFLAGEIVVGSLRE